MEYAVQFRAVQKFVAQRKERRSSKPEVVSSSLTKLNARLVELVYTVDLKSMSS